MIRLNKLCKKFPSGKGEITTANNLTVDIPDNQFVVLFGESGSGKSTLLNMLGGLMLPDSGEIEVHHRHLNTLNEDGLADFRNTICGFIFQNYNLIPYLTAEDNIIFSLVLKSWEKRKAARRAHEVLKQLGIFEKRTHKPNSMSGGEQQRVAIGRAIAHRPKVVLADEPTGNLDERNAEEVLRLLKDLSVKHKTTILVASHSDRVKKYATHSLILQNGNLIHG